MKFCPSIAGRGVSLNRETLDFIPVEMTLRPLRDQMIVEPLDVIQSRILILPPSQKTLRARVLAVGPGHYPRQYNARKGPTRTKWWHGTTFVPAQCKVGDIVRLEGFNNEGFFWGDKYCVHAREEDVAGIEQ